jgi:RNA polymerase sigma factor (sigma-70 family)
MPETHTSHHPDFEDFRKFCKKDKVFQEEFYKDVFPLIKRMIFKNNGNSAQAEDVFHDGLIGLLRYCKKANFILTASLKSFFYTICRNLWLKELKKKSNSRVTFRDVWEYVELKELANEDGEQERVEHELMLMLKHLNEMSEKERQVLMLYYFEEKSHEEIARMVGFKSADSAKVQKFKYLARLRETILRDKEWR